MRQHRAPRVVAGQRAQEKRIADTEAALVASEQALRNVIALLPFSGGRRCTRPHIVPPRPSPHTAPAWMQIPAPRDPGPQEVRRHARPGPPSPRRR